MPSNRRKVYDDNFARDAKPCPACGCRHIETIGEGKNAIRRCRNCGRLLD